MTETYLSILIREHGTDIAEADQNSLTEEYSKFVRLCQQALDINADPNYRQDQRKGQKFYHKFF